MVWLKLNECAQKISSLIKEAEEECGDDDRTGEMERRVTHAATKGVIVDLRAGISEKCLEFSESLPPRVVLKRLPETELAKFFGRKTLVLDRHPTPIKIEVSEEDDECRSVIDNDAVVSEMGDSDTESVIAQEQRKTGTVFDFKALSKSCRRGGRLWCPFCKAVFLGEQRLHLHLVNYHLQPFFFPEEEHKEPSLTSHQFIQIVHHHLFKNIFTENPVTEFVSRCPHCSKTFRRENAIAFKFHIVKAHKVSLVQRLKQLQQDPMLLEKLLKIRKGWVCKCGVHVATGKMFNTHQQKFCRLLGNTPGNRTENLNVAKQTRKIVHQQIKSYISQSHDGTWRASCPHCRAVFDNKCVGPLTRLMEIHLTAFHVHTFFPEEDLKDPSLSSYQFQQVIHQHLFANISTDPENMNLLKCPNCSITMTKKKMSRLRMHVIKCHSVTLFQRLQELQKDSMILKKSSKISNGCFCECGAYYAKGKLYNMHRSQYCRLIEKTPTNVETSSELLKRDSVISSKQTDSSISKSANGTVQISCPRCSAFIKTKYSRILKLRLQEHLIRHHLQTYFPEDTHKDPSLNSLQFKQVISHFLFKNIVSDPDPKSKKIIYKCSYCKATNAKILGVKLHEIKYHHFSLAQRLNELQKDALIFEKLGKIPKGFSCKCGDYFMSDKQFKLHREKFCKLKGDHVEASASRETDSSTCKTERDPLESDDDDDDDEAMTEVDADDHFSESEGLCSIDIGDVKPRIGIGTYFGEQEIGRSERKRKVTEQNSIPRKEIKLDL